MQAMVASLLTEDWETYQFLGHPEELGQVSDHIPKAAVHTHVRPDPGGKLGPCIRAFKPVGKVKLFYIMSLTPNMGSVTIQLGFLLNVYERGLNQDRESEAAE